MADGMPQMILLMIMLNISWLYSCPKIPDPVMENRSQSLLLPVAMAAALFIEQYPLFAPYLIWVIGFYFLRSALRNQFWSKRLFFWRQAHLEAPYKLRPRLNYGVALSAIGRTEDALKMYQNLVHIGDRASEAGTAAVNLSILYIQQHQLLKDKDPDGANEWIKLAAELLTEAETRWPRHSRVRHCRGVMYMGYSLQHSECWQLAIDEFLIAIKLNPKQTDSMREAARCYGRLGDGERAKALIEKAVQIDGRKTTLTYEPAPSAGSATTK